METRRQFLKKALYTAPVIMTVAVRPSFGASAYGNPNGGGGGTPPPTPATRTFRRHGGSSGEWYEFWRWF